MVTYRVWVDNKRGDDYYYRATSKKAAGKLALKYDKKGKLNSVVQNTRKGERYLTKAELINLKKIAEKKKKPVKKQQSLFGGIKQPNLFGGYSFR